MISRCLVVIKCFLLIYQKLPPEEGKSFKFSIKRARKRMGKWLKIRCVNRRSLVWTLPIFFPPHPPPPPPPPPPVFPFFSLYFLFFSIPPPPSFFLDNYVSICVTFPTIPYLSSFFLSSFPSNFSLVLLARLFTLWTASGEGNGLVNSVLGFVCMYAACWSYGTSGALWVWDHKLF